MSICPWPFQPWPWPSMTVMDGHGHGWNGHGHGDGRSRSRWWTVTVMDGRNGLERYGTVRNEVKNLVTGRSRSRDGHVTFSAINERFTVISTFNQWNFDKFLKDLYSNKNLIKVWCTLSKNIDFKKVRKFEIYCISFSF